MSGGVIPNGPDGITKGPLQEATGVDAQTGGIARLATFDQPTAEALLKALFVQGNTNLGQVVELIFTGLRTGISLPLAIIEGIAKRVLGLPDDFMFFNVDQALSMLKKVPLVADLVELITGVEDGDLEDLGTWFLNFRNFLGSLNFLDPNFDIQDAAGTFIELVLWPANRIAKLVGGFIPILNIPGIDASKIISGAFNDQFLPGLLGLFNNISAGFFGGQLPGQQYTTDDVFVGVSGQAQAVSTISAQLAKLQAMMQDDDPSTTVVEDDFEYVASALKPELWTLVEDTGPQTGGLGSVKVDNGQAYWEIAGSAVRRLKYRFSGPNWKSDSDNMTVKIVLGDYLTPFTNTYLDVYTRMSEIAGNQSCIRFRLSYGRFELGWIDAAGGFHLIGNQNIGAPGAGSILYIDSGVGGGANNRTHAININGQTWTWTESGSVSVIGATNRGRGIGWECATAVWLGVTYTVAPGNVAHWASQNLVAA